LFFNRKKPAHATACHALGKQTQQANPAPRQGKPKTIGKAFPWCQTPKKAKQTQQGKAKQGKKNPALGRVSF